MAADVMETGSYNLIQKTFALSMAANLVASETGSADALAASLKDKVNAYLKKHRALIGDWTIVWDPVVFGNSWSNVTPNPDVSVADNAMYVARQVDGTTERYVVAIAATNFQSMYDWMVEDLQTNRMTTLWAGGPMVSQGTATGVQRLLDMKNGGISLHDFLSSAIADINSRNNQSQLIITGHSLAGALSPALALYLQGQGWIDQWDERLVLPTAGPTPGDQSFQTQFDTAFAATPEPSVTDANFPVQTWNTLFWNSNDVVPHAWTWEDLGALPMLYGAGAKIPNVNALVEFAYNQTMSVNSGNSVYARIRNVKKPHPQKGKDVTSLPLYLRELVFQHIGAYYDLLEVDHLERPVFIKDADLLLKVIEFIGGEIDKGTKEVIEKIIKEILHILHIGADAQTRQ